MSYIHEYEDRKTFKLTFGRKQLYFSWSKYGSKSKAMKAALDKRDELRACSAAIKLPALSEEEIERIEDRDNDKYCTKYNRRYVVTIYAKNKIYRKTFSFSKFSDERQAYYAAIMHRNEQMQKLKLKLAPKSKVAGVSIKYIDGVAVYVQASWTDLGAKKVKYFSIKDLGFDSAWAQAVAKRQVENTKKEKA
jgi:hypothetical protein